MEMLGGGSSSETQENILTLPQRLRCGCSLAIAPSKGARLSGRQAEVTSPDLAIGPLLTQTPGPREGQGELHRPGSSSHFDCFSSVSRARSQEVYSTVLGTRTTLGKARPPPSHARSLLTLSVLHFHSLWKSENC